MTRKLPSDGELPGRIRQLEEETAHLKESESRLRITERWLNRIFNALEEAVFVVTLDRRITSMNDAAIRMFGYSSDELASLSTSMLHVDEAHHERFGERIEEALGRDETARFTFELKRKNGDVFPSEHTVSALRGDRGERIGMVHVVRDITDRKKIEERLRQNETKHRRAQEVAHIGHWELDSPDGVPRWSEEIFRIFGIEPEEGEPSFTRHDTIIHPDEWPVLEEAVRAGFRAGEAFDLVFRILRPDNKIGWMQAIGKPEKDDEGRTVKMFGTAQDITRLKHFEQELFEANLRIRETVRGGNIGLWDWDLVTNKVQYSAEWKSQIGYAEDEITDDFDEWRRRVHPDDIMHTLEAVNRSIEACRDDHYAEFRFRHKDGSWRWIAARGSILTDDEGKPVRLVGSHVDITERKRVEERLLQDQYYLAKAQELGRIGTWELDLERNKLVWTDENCRIFGVPPGSVVNYEIFLDKVHPDDREYVDREWRAALQGKPYDIHHRIRVHGRTRWVREKADVDFDEEGKALKAVGFTQDITQLRRAEDSLRESEKKFRDLFERSADAHVFFEEGRFTDCNQACLRMLGMQSRDQLMGRHPADISPERQEDGQGSMEKARQMLDLAIARGSHRFEWTCLRTDGEKIYLDVLLNSVKRGGTPAIHGVWRDITERRRAEETTKRLEAQLRQAQKMEAIGTLSGGIAHDFNNILGIIVGNIELAMNDVPEWNPARNNLTEVMKASLRARDMVRQILTFSRRSEQAKKPVRLGLIVRETLKMLRATIPATVEIREEVSSGRDTVLADPTQMNQVLLNLCGNAAHAMRQEGGRLRVCLEHRGLAEDAPAPHPGLGPGDWLVLTVSDTGHGIDPEIREKIFDPYFTTKGVGEGTGMGLSVVHGIVQDHGGALVVHSQPGKGADFEIYLPLLDEAGEPQEEDVLPFPTGTERVLLVEDDEDLALLGTRMLEQLRYEVTAKTSSLKALELFREEPDRFDLVITDMTMPHMTGADLSLELMRVRPDIPVILCTGFSEMMSEEKAEKMGIRAFVTKPLSMRVLAETVRKVLES